MELTAYKNWINSEIVSKDLKDELKGLSEEELYDRFYKTLEFGTGGLRGVMGAGTNRMNNVTVALATQGFADYLLEKFEEPSVVIAYDSRNNSKEFAKVTALTFAGNGIKAYLYKTLEPTPILSYSVRKLACNGGVVVTASHNKKQYNGYKIYDEFGGQVTADAEKVIEFVKSIKDFSKIKQISENDALKDGLLEYIDDSILENYFERVKGLISRKELVKSNAKDLKIVYTPLHGTGNIPVRRVLGELGFENLYVVKEQELPDGEFRTLVYPNPEDPNAFKLAIELANQKNADIIIGTDPDCDRIGLVAKDVDGEYRVLTGNETGLLLTEYLLKAQKEQDEILQGSFIVKTIVTTEAIKPIAEDYDVDVIEVLTGFKYIAEQIRELSDIQGRKYIFGFEESYGSLAGDFVRDKDAVIASALIAEMVLFYKTNGKTVFDALADIYEKYGYFKETLVSIEIEGQEGIKKISNCMSELRNFKATTIGERKIEHKFDFEKGIKIRDVSLPSSNVLKFELENNYSFIVRPSGTEPKIKIYLSIREENKESAQKELEKFKVDVMGVVNTFLQ
ncbi:MAG: phospho-sugar mutase [Sarcina sp.]